MKDLDDYLQEHHEEPKIIICMALMKMGELMTALSGKAGGTINSRNKGGTYIKNFTMPTNPRTVYQIGVRNAFTAQSQAWRGLTQAQRDAWNAATGNFPYTNAVGDTKFLSGLALFTKLNINLGLCSVAPLTSPPTPGAVSAVLSIVPTYVGGVVTVAFTPTPVPANTSFLLWATPGYSPGIKNVNNRYRFIKNIASTTASPFIASTVYTARFGAASVGTKVSFGLLPINTVTGEAGIMLQASTIVS